MPLNPESDKDVARLRQAMVWSERKLRTFRQRRMEMMRQYVGFNYGDYAASDKVPINLIELGVNIYQRQIASRQPQVNVSTNYKQLEAGAADLELAVNFQIEQMQLANCLNSAGIEALFSIGAVKVGVATDGTPDTQGGYLHDTGEVFADPILFEDLIFDMTAKRREKVSFIGNRYRVPLSWVKDNPQFDKGQREKAQLSQRQLSNVDRGGIDTHSESLSQGQDPVVDEYYDQCDLVEIWLPEEKVVLTLMDDQEGKPLRIVEWEGPRGGPFHLLSFGEVPGNILPLPPVSLWKDLHEITNQLFNKAARQANRQKTITLVQGQARDDGSRTVEANDGEMIMSENPGAVQEVRYGGADQQTLAMVIWSKDMLSYMGGNWDVLGGLAAQSGTVGQEKILQNNSSQRVQDMQARMLEFEQGITTDIAWWLWNDPLIKLPLTKPIGNSGFSIPITFDQTRKMGEFFHYNFKVNPYSRQAQSPTEKAQAITQFITQIVMPMMPALQAQGIQINSEAFFKLFAKYMHLPELNDLFVYGQGQQIPDQQAVLPPPGMPANTSRSYVRENRPAGTRQGKDQALVSMLMGGGGGGKGMSQPAEMAGLMRQAS